MDADRHVDMLSDGALGEAASRELGQGMLDRLVKLDRALVREDPDQHREVALRAGHQQTQRVLAYAETVCVGRELRDLTATGRACSRDLRCGPRASPRPDC